VADTRTLEEKVEAGESILVALAEDAERHWEGHRYVLAIKALREMINFAADLTGEAVMMARTPEFAGADVSWQVIAEALGMSRQAAFQRFGDWEPTQRAALRGGEEEIWKLNVYAKHVRACATHLKFGSDKPPVSVRRGELLLLQVNKASKPDPHGRIVGALVFDESAEDTDGESAQLWGRGFRYLIHASEFVELTPFSLEDLGLVGAYSRQGQANHQRILPEDREMVRQAIERARRGHGK